MKVKSVHLKNFKRFTDLKIVNIPESVKLVVLVGPNGSGKTSVFDGFHHFYRLMAFGQIGDFSYYAKSNIGVLAGSWHNGAVQIEFYNEDVKNRNQAKGRFYFRTAYRNEPDFTVSNLQQQNDPTGSSNLKDLGQNDQTVSENYQRLIGQTLASLYQSSNDQKTVLQLREELIGKVRESLNFVFDDLNLSSIGDPLNNGSFYFEKGNSKDFHYKNLSAGEKTVFDLILDMIIKANYYSDSIFCIDEPEAHMHTRLQGIVLSELFRLTPVESQLWISTHSIGMIRQAEIIEKSNPGSVVFLDFNGRDFDQPEVIEPSSIDRTIWEKFFDLAIGEFSQLISPKRIVFCEGDAFGKSNQNFDAQIYGNIFKKEYYDTKFVSIGSCSEIEKIENVPVNVVSKILNSSEIIKFIDRDSRSAEEIAELRGRGIKTSVRRHLECYLFDDELIRKLCSVNGKADLVDECLQAKYKALADSVARGYPSDDVKSASRDIVVSLKRILQLTQGGNNTSAFLRDTIAPLITSDMTVYKELEHEIFK